MVFVGLYIDFEYTEIQENTMYFDEVQDATVCLKNKRFCWHHFSVLYNLFSRLMVFLACDKMSQEVFAAIGELILLTPKSSKRNLILSGKVGILPSTERAVGQQQPENNG